jgi:hypothetical protein
MVGQRAEGLDTGMSKRKQDGQLGETRELPPGVKLVRALEGHESVVLSVAFDPTGQIIPEARHPNWSVTGLAFHPTLPLLATIGSRSNVPEHERSMLIHLWKLDLDLLLSNALEARITVTVSDQRVSKAVHHTTAKIVLVGDAGVGKTGLGWRLAHDEYKEHPSSIRPIAATRCTALSFG